MASIIKRKSKYSVVYYYTDEKGVKHQKWETCQDHAEAKRRKAEIENQQGNGTFIPPQELTVKDFLREIAFNRELFAGFLADCTKKGVLYGSQWA